MCVFPCLVYLRKGTNGNGNVKRDINFKLGKFTDLCLRIILIEIEYLKNELHEIKYIHITSRSVKWYKGK